MLLIGDVLLGVLDGEVLEKRVRVVRGKVSSGKAGRGVRIIERAKVKKDTVVDGA